MHAAASELPPALARQVEQWLAGQRAGPLGEVLASPEIASPLARVVACSHYLAEVTARYPDHLPALLSSGRLARPLGGGEAARLFDASVTVDLPEADCLAVLRRLRHQELLRIGWRQLNAAASPAETVRELSAVADAAIGSALRWAEAQLQQVHGQPLTGAGDPASFAVVAMGKLGGRELNFSSDVDLVFVYSEGGETTGPRRVSNEQYFRALGQRLVGLLAQRTADGFVYRVDTRLRPFGDSGPLAVSLPALEAYLQTHGRDWERYAYIKARVVNDWPQTRELEEEILRPFVYRRYLDYGVFDSLRAMKALIEAEGRRREYRDNLKLGRGGIREVEFIVQSLQLVRGGTIADLRQRELPRALEALVRHRCLGAEVADELMAAYWCLRQAENCLQAIDDRQTHDLPQDDGNRRRLALALGQADWQAAERLLGCQRDAVARHFAEIVFRGDGAGDERAPDPLARAWLDGDRARLRAALTEAGLDEPDSAAASLQALRDSSVYQRLDEAGRQRLDRLMPRLLRAVAGRPAQARALDGLLQIIAAIGRRSAYFALLNENPAALDRLVELSGLSQFLVQQIAAHPLLLDELLDARIFAEPPGRDELATELRERLAAAGDDDPERRLYALVNFQQAATFRVAVADLSGALPLMKVSDRLTDIAELVLEAALAMAWSELTARHGQPRCEEAGRRRPARFGIVGYGKLGGLELGYGSDLDLVFVHDSTSRRAETDGARPLDNAVFFGRLTRRVIGILTLATPSGSMYEVDTRLRPSGRSGLLVSSLAAFERYQRDDAWTWEHQALLRSRAVAGPPEIRSAYEDLRRQVLLNYVHRERLRDDVVEMRERMRRELSQGDAGRFDIKQDPGGIADIEFIVQYLVLREARRYPDLIDYSDNIRQLEGLARHALLPAERAGRLADAYREYRGLAHRASLAGQPALLPREALGEWPDQVLAIWQEVFG